MFAAETKAVIKNVGADATLISNNNLGMKMDLLNLVKVSEGRFWQFPKYHKFMYTLQDLVEEAEDFSPEVSEEVLVKDFLTSVETSGTGKLGGGDGAVGEAEVSAGGDTVDALVQPVSINKKRASLKAVRSKFSGRMIQKEKIKLLKLKETDKLTFVHETVYNTGPVKVMHKSNRDGSISASCQKMLKLLFKGSKKEETTFTIPEKATFAYGLMEIMLEDEKMEIPLEPWTHKRSNLDLFDDGENSQILQQVQEGIQMKEPLLKPLASVPESTRLGLLKNLQAVLEDEDGLSKLEESLEQSSKDVCERPPSQVVSSFMDLVQMSNMPIAVKDAIHLLVSAMDALPQGMLQPLTSCSPDTLRVLSQMVEGLREDAEVRVPDSLPPPLQEEGELRLVVELLSSTNEVLEELSDSWDRPPEVLLEVLALTVLGLDMMQSRN